MWNGETWSEQSTATGENTILISSAVSCASGRFCEAVGSLSDADIYIVLFPWVQVWNGKGWLEQSTPSPVFNEGPFGDILSGVTCTSATFCEAVGSGYQGPGNASWVQIWNGRKWIVQATPDPGAGRGLNLNDVSCTSLAFCETVGDYVNRWGDIVPVAESWRGKKWKAQTMPYPN
jgi:hypothetical protein